MNKWGPFSFKYSGGKISHQFALDTQMHRNLLWICRRTEALVTVNAEMEPHPLIRASHNLLEPLLNPMRQELPWSDTLLPAPTCLPVLRSSPPSPFASSIHSSAQRSILLGSLQEREAEEAGCPCSSYHSTAYSGEREWNVRLTGRGHVYQRREVEEH